MDKMSQDNMKLWNEVCTTNPKHTTKFRGKGGFQGTAVCAQSQRMRATELWGPFGHKWGIRNEQFSVWKLSEDPHDNIVVYRATMYYPADDEDGVGEVGLASDISVFNYSNSYKSWSRTSDILKKVRTDAITKGLSELGFNADVFLGLFDDNKYVQAQKVLHSSKDGENGLKTASKSKRNPPSKQETRTTDDVRKRIESGVKALQDMLRKRDIKPGQTMKILEAKKGWPDNRYISEWELPELKKAEQILIDTYREQRDAVKGQTDNESEAYNENV
jgi:hypothetical protein